MVNRERENALRNGSLEEWHNKTDWKTLYVTAEDVINGVEGNACECPIALAMYREECKGGLFKTQPYIGAPEDMTIRPKNGGRPIALIDVHDDDYLEIESFIELFDDTGDVCSANNQQGWTDKEKKYQNPEDIVFAFRYIVRDIEYNTKETK